MYPKDFLSYHRDISKSMFIDDLFTKQRNRTSLDANQVVDNENVVHIDNEVLFISKKNEIMKFAAKYESQ